MIPSLNLDNQNFKDIFDAMLVRMTQYYGGDMDTSYQEPGVALLELFCLLKDMQQFYLNFISDKHKLSYIRLLGGCKPAAAPSETIMVFIGKGVIPKGFLSFARGIPFETSEELRLSENRICAAASGQEGSISGIPIWTRSFHPFGQDMKDGTSLYVGFSCDIRKRPVHSLYFELENPVGELAVPLGELQISFFSSRKKWEILYFEDETKGFSVSGKIHFSILREMSPLIIDGLEAYWIRITLINNYFELPPELSGIYINAVKATQTLSLASSEEYMVSSDNTIKLKTFLEQEGIIELQKITEEGFSAFNDYTRISPETLLFADDCKGKCFLVLAWAKDFEGLLTELNGTPNQKIIFPKASGTQRLEILNESKGVWEIWSRCKDLAAAGSLDKCFFVEEDRIYFGNDENGAIPPVGIARVIDCCLTEGAKGNIREGAIDHCASKEIQGTNIRPGEGGGDAPAAEEALRMLRKNLNLPGRAVTLEDYRQIILQMPRLAIEQVKAVCDEGVIVLYVRPKSFRPLPKLSRIYKENILSYIEPFRILTTQIDIRSPEYFGVVIYVGLVVESAAHGAAGQVINAVHSILPGEATTFFDSLSHGSIYGLIHGLPFVKRIESLYFECGGQRVKSGFYRVKQGGILYLEDIKMKITAE